MRVEVKVPAAGESVKEADIARWFKEDGDYVALDEPLCELETDKASLEVTAMEAGRLSITVGEGETVAVGQVIGQIDTEADKPQAKKAGKEPPAATKPSPEAETATIPPAAKDDEDDDEDEDDKAKHASVFNMMMPSPAARKLISENKLSAQDIEGSGRDGRITKSDVLQYLEQVEREEQLRGSRPATVRREEEPAEEMTRHPAFEQKRATPERQAEAPEVEAPPAANTGDRAIHREKMSRIRKTIAQRLVKTTQELAMLTTFNEVDMGAIKEIRAKYKDSFKEKHQVGLGFMSFFTRAVCIALKEFPLVNAQVDGEDIVYHDYCDIGIAVSTPKGLLVPVLRNAEKLTFEQIESAIIDLATRGRDGKLSIDEMSNGTFTITNGGIFGSMLSTPLINYPQSGILGMHNIVDRPVAVDGQVVIRPIMYLALSYDHRIIDGAGAVRFLVRVKELLEDPVRLMLNV